MQLRNAVGAEGVSAMHQNSGNTLAHVVLETAKLTDIKTARFVVKLDDVHFFILHLNINYK